jgi:hypothetical protein
MLNKNWINLCIFSLLVIGLLTGKEISSASPLGKTGNLKIKVGVVMKSGDVKYIAKTDFSLLKVSMASLVKLNEKEFVTAIQSIPNICLLKDLDSFYILERAKLIDDFDHTIVKNCTTGFDGICTFTNVPAGQYYLTPFENVDIGMSHINWDVKVQIQPGITKYIELSNNNASDFWITSALKQQCGK